MTDFASFCPSIPVFLDFYTLPPALSTVLVVTPSQCLPLSLYFSQYSSFLSPAKVTLSSENALTHSSVQWNRNGAVWGMMNDAFLWLVSTLTSPWMIYKLPFHLHESVSAGLPPLLHNTASQCDLIFYALCIAYPEAHNLSLQCLR